ncbi:alpha-L-arabinofuranosidase B [Streptomyces sp. NPDC047081]|uniref:alpha-L-arabinofuranosidase B n=1 Tax=Streptomyces sp. NPDC047081 TaxID=3154706 RepID=UPI0033E390B2
MSIRAWIRRARRALLATGAAGLLTAGVLAGTATTSQAATQEPCDIYASGGTPCVAAHSTTRALYAAYNGPLYQVRRASDSATKDIGLLSAGGYADAAAQDSFCTGTSCVITVIYDQSGKGNNLTQAPKGQFPGPAAGGNDNLAPAAAEPITVGGHKAYGVFVGPGTGYRDNSTNGIATGDQPEGMYAVLDGTHYNGNCCFDYGNAEIDNRDDGDGTMEAIYFGNIKVWGYGAGKGAWVMADMENNLFSGQNTGYNAGDPTVSHRFLTATLKGQPNHWAMRAGNAQTGGLSTYYDGVRPTGYATMKKQGAIVLGIGGDNSNGASGTFYEGVMTSGYPTAATEDAVQANITSVAYTAPAASTALTPGSRISLRATTACCTSDYIKHDDSDEYAEIANVTSSSSSTTKADATWIVRAGLSDSSCVSFESANNSGAYLRHYAYRLRLNANDGTSTFAQDATFCPQPGNSGQGFSFRSDNFTARYLRHYAFNVYIGQNGLSSNSFDSMSSFGDDSTWMVASPWS